MHGETICSFTASQHIDSGVFREEPGCSIGVPRLLFSFLKGSLEEEFFT
jgi:hypothetical protein